MSDCLFCKIVAGDIPADKVHEDDHVVAFKDINPQAPVHLLVIPRKHITSLDEATDEDGPLLGRLLLTAQKLAGQAEVSGAYRVVNNCGRPAGQSVFHVHVHLLKKGRTTRGVGPKSQHIREESRPAVGKSFVRDQLIDQLLSTVGGRPLHIAVDFLARRNPSDHVDRNAAQKSQVIHNRPGLGRDLSRPILPLQDLVKLRPARPSSQEEGKDTDDQTTDQALSHGRVPLVAFRDTGVWPGSPGPACP